jgi:hypothetical protein
MVHPIKRKFEKNMEIMGLEIEKKEAKLDKVIRHLNILFRSKLRRKRLSVNSRVSMKGSAKKTRLKKSPMRIMRQANEDLKQQKDILEEKLVESENRMAQLEQVIAN